MLFLKKKPNNQVLLEWIWFLQLTPNSSFSFQKGNHQIHHENLKKLSIAMTTSYKFLFIFVYFLNELL